MANKLQYNYEDLFIHKNQFEKTASNGKYYKIPFSNISKSNITSNMFQGNYIATTIYIVRKIHTIPKMNFDGELLIQHKSQSNDEKPLFISIPLKTQQAIVSKIDLLTQPNKDVELNLNEDIYSNSASYYENDKQRVVILHNVLNVGIQFENLSTGNVVTPKSTFTDVSIEPILGKEGFIEGNEDTTTYVENAAYCVPIDENDHTIQNDASTIIPAGSETNQHKTLVSQLTTATNFAIFFTLAIFVIWTIPTIYHIFIVLLIMNNYGLSRNQLFNRISGADIMTSFIFIGISFSLIVNGVGTKDPTVSVVGFYFLIFYMLIFARLQYDRLLNNGTSFVEYITKLHQNLQTKLKIFIQKRQKLESLNINEDSLPYLKEEEVKMDEITPDIGGFLMENTMNLFYDKGVKEENGQNISVEKLSKTKIPLFLVFFGGPFVTLLLFDMLQQGSFITYLPVYFIFISLYILAFYEYSYRKFSNENLEEYIFYEYLKKQTQKKKGAQAP